MLLDVHVLGWKTWGMNGLIFYKTKNGTSAMKKHCEVKHSNILKMYVCEIVQWQCYFKTNAFQKQNSKVWKVVILGFKDFSILNN